MATKSKAAKVNTDALGPLLEKVRDAKAAHREAEAAVREAEAVESKASKAVAGAIADLNKALSALTG